METYTRPKIFITAGEASGDVHAARLMAEIRRRIPDVVFEGFGGPEMEMQGLRSLAHIRDLAVTGFVEVAKRYRFFTDLLNRCEATIQKSKPDLFIPVDYPGFNMRLAARVRTRSLPVLWYIAPQLWAWGEKRASKLSSVVDKLLVVFPFEVDFFAKHGIAAEYVGHPLVETLPETHEQRIPNRVLLMPGSRAQEISHHVPLLREVVRTLRVQHSEVSCVVAKSSSVTAELLKPLTDEGAILVSDARTEMLTASAGLIKAGTSTLEATLSGLPFSTFYKTSFLTYQISRHLINVQSVTLCNLLLKKNVVKEFIQQDATPQKLVQDAVDMLRNETRRVELESAMQEVRTMLQGGGASSNAAQIAVSMVRQR